jgi:hypothetical protein
MAYDAHYRVTAIGKIGGSTGPEMFTFGFALARFDNGVLSPLLDPNDTVWDDVADDVRDFFAATPIHPDAQLQVVKIAPIGEDGLYTGPPVEKSRVQNATGGPV